MMSGIKKYMVTLPDLRMAMPCYESGLKNL